MASLENKVVIITGCSSGIGLATTLLFLSRKALVFGVDISPFKHELETAQEANFSFQQTDLTKPNAAEETVAACVAKYGSKIDVLANVAGIMDAFSSVDTLKDSEWDCVISINLTVPVKLMTAVLPSMKEHGGGSIVNVCSYSSQSGAAAGVAYTASKHGLLGATKNVAWRFHTEGIRCNAIAPGGVATNLSSSMAMENFDKVAYNIIKPIHDIYGSFKRDDLAYGSVSADDVARGIAFLASDDAKAISGVLLPVDNAWSTT